MNTEPKPHLILMADDDDDDRLLAQDALKEAKIPSQIQFVGNGQELLDYLFQQGNYKPPAASPRPGLILLDLNMPCKDGREALREIKASPELRRIPVVVLTTSQADTDINAIYDLGANSFITKPFQYKTLVKLMKTLGQYWFRTVELPVPR